MSSASSPPVRVTSLKVYRCSSRRSMRRCASTRRSQRGSGARSLTSSSPATTCPPACTSNTSHGPAIDWPTCSPIRTSSVPSAWRAEEKGKLPRGAYVPFGGGRRICVGKRFGYLEAKVISSRVLQRFSPEVEPHTHPQLRWSATLQPKGGLPMRIAHPGNGEDNATTLERKGSEDSSGGPSCCAPIGREQKLAARLRAKPTGASGRTTDRAGVMSS
jgi:Cytochrome P450